MIKIKKNKNNIKISGHSKYNDYGKDIVCASVSSIVYTTINSILNINPIAIEVTDGEDLVIKILSDDVITTKLISTMLELLEDLSKQYPKNIKI